MALVPTRPLREKILLFGGPGGGKTTAALMIARAIREQNNRLHVIDTDDGVEKLLATEFADLDNVSVTHVYRFDEYVAASDAIRRDARPGDWVLVDMISHAWESVQRYFTDQVFGKNLGEYFLDARRRMEEKREKGEKTKRGSAFDGWQDWSVINGVYRDWIAPLVVGMPFHLIACAEGSSVGDDDAADLRRLFPSGVKPAGQKHLAHQFDTVILLEPPRNGTQQRRATTFKDRGRKPFTDDLMVNFVLQYLMARAGWRRT